VRGLGWGIAGPKDPGTGEAIGGTKELVFNAEYIFPIIQDLKIKGVVFVDAGQAYASNQTLGTDLRYTSGAGLRWASPFGPIRIEYGVNLAKRAGEAGGKIEFAFGQAF
jgi:outer membrane protein insertion porin family